LKEEIRAFALTGLAIIDVTVVKDEILKLATHEDCPLAIHRAVENLLHPVRYMYMPFAACLPDSINAFEKLLTVTFRHRW
jgi:hypothetical protein